jgi:2,5-diketo-D-gluconate reductase A
MTSITDQVPRIALRDDGQIPQLGFGVFQIPQEDTVEAVTHALSAGYRHIDTAAIYGNEGEVGQAIKASGIPREELFITTKCFNNDHGYEQAKHAFKASLDRLELDYLDLYLIHWPVPSKDLYVETWKAFVELQKDGFVRSIGVSNFQAAHLRRIIDETGVTPSVNQIELHPYLQQQGLRREHEDRGIVTEAWSPIAQGKVLDDDVLTEIGKGHGKSASQVTLRWHLQLGNVVFPKSVTKERIEENLDVFDFHLSESEMERIAALDAGTRLGPDPDAFG